MIPVKLWPYATGALAALVALLLFGFWSRGNEIDRLKTDVAACGAAHNVTRASLNRLEKAQADATAQTLARAKEFEIARAEAEAVQVKLRASDVRNASLAARLEESARTTIPASACEPSKLAKEVWK